MLGYIIFALLVLVLWGAIQWGEPFFVFAALTEFMLEACEDDWT